MNNNNVDWTILKRDHLNKIADLLSRLQLDAIYVNELDNVRYLTNFRPIFLDEWYCHGYSGILAKGSQEPILICPEFGGRPGEQEEHDVFPRGARKAPVGAFVAATVIPDLWAETVVKVFTELNLRENAIIGLDCLTAPIYEKLREKLPRIKFQFIMNDLLEIRATKNAEEIKLLREAAHVVDEGIEVGYSSLKPGVTERQVYAKMIQRMFELGTEAVPWSANLTSGPGTSSIFPTDRRIDAGDLIMADIGSVIGGFHGDIARTGAFGKVSKEAKEIYSMLIQVHKAGIKAVAPGVRVSDVDKKIRETFKEYGYDQYRPASGHGLGLRTYDLPCIVQSGVNAELDARLRPGMIIGLEPQVSKTGLGNAALEDMILVTESGSEVLTKASYYEDLLT